MLATLLFTVACLVPGVPAAIVLRRRGDGLRWSDVAVEGLVLGLAWWLVLGLLVATFGDLGAVTLLVPTALATAGLVALALPSLRHVPAPRATRLGAATAVVV